IRALLAREGFRPRTGHSDTFVERARELALPDWIQEVIAPLLETLTSVNDQVKAMDNRLKRMADEDGTARRLMTVPGVGPVIALAFVATVDHVPRFRNAHQLESYLGLVPREWSSSEVQRRGAITKAGSKRMRWLLVQAARAIARTPGRSTTRPLWEWADRI